MVLVLVLGEEIWVQRMSVRRINLENILQRNRSFCKELYKVYFQKLK